MIRVSPCFPNQPGATFDHDYFRGPHRKLVLDRLSPEGMLRYKQDRGLAGYGGAPAPYVAVGHLVFDSMEAFQSAWGVHGDEILRDVPNFTSTEPTVQISEIAAV